MNKNPKTALITGASSGIGRELAKVFAAEGHDLILVSRSQQELELLAVELQAEYDGDVKIIAKDLFDPAAAKAVYDEVKALGIVVNFLVNDAGQGGTYGPFVDTDLEAELGIIQLNVASLVVLTKLFLRDMVARDEGRILQLASLVSKTPSPLMAVYAGTKAFIYNFAESVNGELKDSHVTMTALQPGATDTDFFHKSGATQAKIVQKGELADPAKVARDGYEAMMRGKDHVVSGAKNKLMAAAGNLVPDSVLADQMRKMQEPKQSRA